MCSSQLDLILNALQVVLLMLLNGTLDLYVDSEHAK